MRSNVVSRLIPLAPAAALLVLTSGCGLLTVDMTSTPASVKRGDPVTFNITLTNHSQCPLQESVALLVPFISQAEINAEFGAIPPDVPPEVVDYLEALRAFLDELCTGGTPVFPTPPFATHALARTASTLERGLAISCHRTDEAIVCGISGRLRTPAAGTTFTLFDNRLDCAIGDQVIGCEFRIPLGREMSRAKTSAAITPLTCLTAAEFAAVIGVPPDVVGDEFGAICFLGTFPNFVGLGPSAMAAGSVTLPARGTGVQRNLIIALSDDAQDVGVCKGGPTPGDPCDRSSSGECGLGTCAEGICIGGGNNGLGCDVATQMMDCPGGGTCQTCAPAMPAELLPIDCTTTYVSPDPAPVMSAWMLLGLAAMLLATGTFWLQRRRGRA